MLSSDGNVILCGDCEPVESQATSFVWTFPPRKPLHSRLVLPPPPTLEHTEDPIHMAGADYWSRWIGRTWRRARGCRVDKNPNRAPNCRIVPRQDASIPHGISCGRANLMIPQILSAGQYSYGYTERSGFVVQSRVWDLANEDIVRSIPDFRLPFGTMAAN